MIMIHSRVHGDITIYAITLFCLHDKLIVHLRRYTTFPSTAVKTQDKAINCVKLKNPLNTP